MRTPRDRGGTARTGDRERKGDPPGAGAEGVAPVSRIPIRRVVTQAAFGCLVVHGLQRDTVLF